MPNEFKAQIRQENNYSITIKGVTHKGFTKIGEWEGMVKFMSPNGGIVLDLDDGTPKFDFISLFKRDDVADERMYELDIIKVSPELIPSPEETDKI